MLYNSCWPWGLYPLEWIQLLQMNFLPTWNKRIWERKKHEYWKSYLWIRVEVPQHILPVGFIVDCLNVPRLDDPFVHQGDCFSELAEIDCCTSLDIVLEEKLPCFEGEVVAIKNQDGVLMALCFDDAYPNWNNAVHWCCLLELLVGCLKITVKKNRRTIWQAASQLIDPQSNLMGWLISKNER